MVEHRSAKSEGLSSIPHGDSEFFLCSTLETTNIFLWLIVVLLQCRFLIGRQKQCNSLRNRTAESQSDCKDHQWFQNGWKKSQNLQVNKGFKIMKPSSSVYLGGFQRERNQGNVRLLHKNHGSANFKAVGVKYNSSQALIGSFRGLTYIFAFSFWCPISTALENVRINNRLCQFVIFNKVKKQTVFNVPLHLFYISVQNPDNSILIDSMSCFVENINLIFFSIFF